MIALFEYALDRKIERVGAVERKDRPLLGAGKHLRKLFAAAKNRLARPDGHFVAAAPRVCSVKAHCTDAGGYYLRRLWKRCCRVVKINHLPSPNLSIPIV